MRLGPRLNRFLARSRRIISGVRWPWGPEAVSGYHGTNARAAALILQQGFTISRNDYDWLGDGIYFFQDSPARAWEWARQRHGREAAVVASRLRLRDCMDLLDPNWTTVLADSYDSFLAQLKEAGLPLPRQTAGAHRLDRAVINYAVGILAEQDIVVRAVRAAFAEGAPVFPDSALFTRAHVQIAVRDTSLILRTRPITEEEAP
jgi:hypothetical protein